MHLQAVLIFVDLSVHNVEPPCLLNLPDECSIDCEVTNRRAVLVAGGRGGASKIVVVRGSEYEDAFAGSPQ
jgi:hypothetical protein